MHLSLYLNQIMEDEEEDEEEEQEKEKEGKEIIKIIDELLQHRNR